MTPPWTFHSAGSLLFGTGAVAQLGAVAERLRAKRIFIVTDRILVEVGVLERVLAPLAGLEVTVFDGGQPEPALEVIRAATEAAWKAKPDAVLGLGGGSNMDAAKLVALVLAHGGDATDYTGDCRVPGPILPLICVPTTAGTGSEVSAAAVFTDTEKKMKVSCLSPYLRPAAAVVDPSLTATCPAKVVADSGIDALTHAIEALTAVNHAEFLARPPGGETVYQGNNPMADVMAKECIRLVGQHLATAVRHRSDAAACEGMALAATLGGLAFANAGVALVHAMEYPVGGAVHVSHGAGNGLLLPYVMRFNATASGERIREVGAAFLGRPATVDETIAAIETLREAIGIPLRLRELGVTEAMLPGFADRAAGITRLLRVNARPATRDDILGIYREAW